MGVILVIGLLALVPSILGIVRAAQNGDGGWVAAIAVGMFLGFGWLIAVIYLVTAGSRPRSPATGVPPLAPPVQAAGWFTDPRGRFEQRYWDGARWTEHVSRGGLQSTDPV